MQVCYFNDATEQAEIVGNVFKSMETIIQRVRFYYIHICRYIKTDICDYVF